MARHALHLNKSTTVTKRRNELKSPKNRSESGVSLGNRDNHSCGPDCRRRNNNTETSARHTHDASNARSILRNAAIREQFDAVHVCTVIGCEKCRNSTHVIWRTQPAERNIGKNAGLLLVGH
jgi:uncharacterized Zn-finger protein